MERRKRKKEKTASSPSTHQSYMGCWIFSAFVLISIVVIIVIVTTYPYPRTDYYRNSQLIQGETRARVNCTIGEYYDSKIDLCAPLSQPILPELIDNSVNACDSYYNYMSGNWIKTHHNENRAFTYIFRKNQKHVHDIIRDPQSGSVYTFYRSCLDTIVHKQHILMEKQQYNHIYEHIMGSFRTHADLPVTFARLTSYGYGAPFILTIEPHPTLPQMVPLIRADYPLNYSIANLEDFPVTMRYDLEQCLNKLREWSQDDKEFTGSFIDYLRSDRYQSDMSHMGAILDASGEDFWKLYLRELNGYTMEKDLDSNINQPVWLLDKHFIMNIVQNLNKISLREWKAYIEYSIMYHNLNYVPDIQDDNYFRFHNPIHKFTRFRHRMLRNEKADINTCMSITAKIMPGIIGNIYLHKYMKEHAVVQKRVKTVVENVRDAYVDMIADTSWLSQETKEQIVEKLRSIVVRVVHPNYFETETFADRLTIDCYLRNLNIIRKYFATRNFELWTKGKPNRDLIQRFGTPITTVNAFYAPGTNTITIFGGILREPIFSNTFSDDDLYSGIGMIAAHELSHAIDVFGRLFDKDGNFCIKEPWKSNELEEFMNRTRRLMEEYKAPFGCINEQYGLVTIGEDSSDLNGIRAALLAFQKNGGTDLKRFFGIFAQLWAATYSDDINCDRVHNDVHALPNFRVDITLRQLWEFRETYNCKEGDKMVNSDNGGGIVIFGKEKE